MSYMRKTKQKTAAECLLFQGIRAQCGEKMWTILSNTWRGLKHRYMAENLPILILVCVSCFVLQQIFFNFCVSCHFIHFYTAEVNVV